MVPIDVYLYLHCTDNNFFMFFFLVLFQGTNKDLFINGRRLILPYYLFAMLASVSILTSENISRA